MRPRGSTPTQDPDPGRQPAESRACDELNAGPLLDCRNGRLPVEPLAADARGLGIALGISPRHVESLHSRGRLPRPIRLGARRVWVLDEIRRWLAAGAPSREEWEARR